MTLPVVAEPKYEHGTTAAAAPPLANVALSLTNLDELTVNAFFVWSVDVMLPHKAVSVVGDAIASLSALKFFKNSFYFQSISGMIRSTTEGD